MPPPYSVSRERKDEKQVLTTALPLIRLAVCSCFHEFFRFSKKKIKLVDLMATCPAHVNPDLKICLLLYTVLVSTRLYCTSISVSTASIGR